LYALSLWRNYGTDPWFVKTGSDMEARLWTDIAAFYHPGLKNVSGPFDRAYGMDMQAYVSLIGLWLRTVLGPEAAPFPTIGGRMVHSDDMQYAPLFSLLGTSIPVNALEKFRKFSGDHEVRRELPRGRVATAWIGTDFMLGGEAARGSRGAGGQYIPATAHWRTPTGSGAWMALMQGPRADAHVEKQALFINGIGDFTFRVSAPSIDQKAIQPDTWTLPGIAIHVTSDAGGITIQPGDGYADIIYREATRFELRFEKRLR